MCWSGTGGSISEATVVTMLNDYQNLNELDFNFDLEFEDKQVGRVSPM